MKKLTTTITNLIASLALFATLFSPAFALATGPAPADLLSAKNFVLLSKTGITNTGSHTTAIKGNIGTSPITGAALSTVFCSEITGTIYGVDAGYVGSGDVSCYAGNPPAENKTLVDNAVLDMGTAYADLAGRTIPDGTELYAGSIGGHNFTPGLYKWSSDVSILSDITLTGSATDVWIFQISGDFNVASAGSLATGKKVILAGGARASNIFWQVGGVTGATLGTSSTFNGNILSAKAINLHTGSVLNGRALATTEITLDANPVTISTTLPGTLGGNSVEKTKSTATADGTFTNGWKYTFNITVPTNETHLSMKFDNWLRTGGGGTIPAQNNMRYSSAQADNAGGTILITSANTYPATALNIIQDLDLATDGLQVKVIVEVAIPVGSSNGSYTTNYGIKTN